MKIVLPRHHLFDLCRLIGVIEKRKVRVLRKEPKGQRSENYGSEDSAEE
jgi:hypothetical protein